jgi:Fic family protein
MADDKKTRNPTQEIRGNGVRGSLNYGRPTDAVQSMARRDATDLPGSDATSGNALSDILGAALKRATKKEKTDESHSDYNWHPLEPLSDRDREIDLAAMMPLYETWRTSKERLAVSSPEGLKEFNQQLIRRMSIETGILERLYDLDRGTTEALIAHGFVEDLVSRSSTDIEPARLIDILRDQEAAIQLVMDCVARSRPLTKGIIHELHSILTRHQDTTIAVDSLGQHREIPLVKGRFKTLPNNPQRPTGVVHEYCPPVHVDTEIENLLKLLGQYGDEDPIIVAAWFHHRFTQIHPYQDGNGRVGRALTTLILLQSGLLPLVIDRDLRVEYIEALEKADHGDLAILASLFARLERSAIMQALSVDADREISHQRTLTSAVIESLAQKFGRRREARHAELRGVNNLAFALRARTKEQLEEAFSDLAESMDEFVEPSINLTVGGPDRGNSHWYKFEVVQSANDSGKYANFTEAHYFIKASIRMGRERLVFVTSFHHVGRELSGIMEATAFARLESYEDSDDRESVTQDFRLCAVEPFVFTYKTSEAQIAEAFARWLDSSIAVALKEYSDRL